MEKMITGHQFSPVDGRYVGAYDFPDNKDQDEVHLPPFTTLDAPPACDEGHAAFWQNGFWVVRAIPEQIAVPEITDYAMITEGFIQYLISVGKWTAEDQQKRADALDALARQEAEAAAAAATIKSTQTTTQG